MGSVGHCRRRRLNEPRSGGIAALDRSNRQRHTPMSPPGAAALGVGRDAGIDPVPRSDRTLAESLAGPANDGAFFALIASSDDAMTPWPGQPSSIAGGILDDVTYDWKTVLRHQLQTGGWPVLASEEDFIRAERLAAGRRSIDAAMAPCDHTGAAGLAGRWPTPNAGTRARRAIDGPDRRCTLRPSP
ncbi:MAG: hypothetical protein R2710_20430 [Acidimicrobiales bacterium]